MTTRLDFARRDVALLVTVLVLLAVPHTASAQTAAAALRGKAAAGTEVVARNTDTGLTRRTTATADGNYTIVGLPPGPYEVTAGSGIKANTILSVASTTTLDLGEAVAEAPSEGALTTVTVSGTRLPEVRTSEIATTISPIQIETLPQITRNFLEFADTVPGLAFSVDPGGNTSLRGGAQTTSSVNVYIDGVGQKNYVKEGGVSGQFFSQGIPSRSSRSVSTRSSRRTTRPSTTRSPVPPSPRKPSPAPTGSKGRSSAPTPQTISVRARRRKSTRTSRRRRRTRNSASPSAGPSSRTRCISS